MRCRRRSVRRRRRWPAGGSASARLLFLPRHGRGHRYSPSEINYRANVFALKTLGAERVLSVSAVGSLREGLAPGDFVLPDQFIDRTWGRASTFFGDGVVGHVGFAEPTCAAFTAAVAAAAAPRRQAGPPRRHLRLHGGAAVLDARRVAAAPQLGRRRHRHDRRHRGQAVPRGGGLLRVAGAGDRLRRLARRGSGRHRSRRSSPCCARTSPARRTSFAGWRDHVASAAPCGCARAAAHAIITAPDAISAEARGRLRLLHGRESVNRVVVARRWLRRARFGRDTRR